MEMERVYDALRKAHEAGDTASAQKLASYIQSQQNQPTLRQKIIASAPARVLQGMRDPIDAAAQLLPRGLEFVSSYGGLYKNPVSEFFGKEAEKVDVGIGQAEREYQQARQAVGQEGFDAYRMGGNIVSPANLAIAARVPVTATTTMGRAGQGAILGGIGGGLQPVNVEENPDFAATKLGQISLGAATGGVLTLAMGAIGDRFTRFLSAKMDKMRGADVTTINQTAEEFANASGIDWQRLNNNQRNEITNQIVEATKVYSGKDPRVAARIADFKALEMPYTLGQVTREPMQFATEKNLSQLPGTGDPIRERFMQQGASLQRRIGNFAAGAQEEQNTGTRLIQALSEYDKKAGALVSEAYKTARSQAGKDAEIPMQGLAQDFSSVLDTYSANVINNLPINEFKKYGLLGGKQTKIFTIEEADKLIKVINANRSTDPATNSALTALRGAVKKAMAEDVGVDDVFAPARVEAQKRFNLQDAIPALKAASEGDVNPDTFVRNFIISKQAQSPQVMRLANLLREQDPDSYSEARAQIGAYLQRKAFGENVTGDKPFSPERYAAALRELGTDKLKAFFSPQEVAQMQRIARVGSYMEAVPYAARPNVSGNWGAITNLAQNFPGFPQTAALARALRSGMETQLNVSKALKAEPQKQLTPEEIKLLSRALSAGALTTGGMSAQSLR